MNTWGWHQAGPAFRPSVITLTCDLGSSLRRNTELVLCSPPSHSEYVGHCVVSRSAPLPLWWRNSDVILQSTLLWQQLGRLRAAGLSFCSEQNPSSVDWPAESCHRQTPIFSELCSPVSVWRDEGRLLRTFQTRRASCCSHRAEGRWLWAWLSRSKILIP